MPSFYEVYDLLQRKGPATVVSGKIYFRTNKKPTYTITAKNGIIVAISDGGGTIRVHADCWGENITCQKTRAGGIYNGCPSIYDWYDKNK